MYLPKILGYSVLRGEINEDYKYVRPQEHFKEVLMAICNSANFDILKKRIGQTIQMGFALSSDIWVTNLIAPIENKKIRQYLRGQKLERYRTVEARKDGYHRYQRQFRNSNFMTADFPTTVAELKVLWSSLRNFLVHRIRHGYDNASLVPHLKAFVENADFQGHPEWVEITGLYTCFFDLNDKDGAHLAEHLNAVRKQSDDFEERWFRFLLHWHNSPELDMDPAADLRASSRFDKSVKDDISSYYTLLDELHSVGYAEQKAQDALRKAYEKHQGLSLFNECLRRTIFGYIRRFVENLEPAAYHDFFEIVKVFTIYSDIFRNERFNKDVKDVFMGYVRQLLATFTDKRGKDYQDIKRFVSGTFPELGLLKEKEVVELFKTRRRRKKTEAV
ncbi:MAG: hypothetical protein D6765_05850 [Bacteroidetes bacterium]|nr:MAG: hypothetical protein D6765_05850 [Bacteroidota bacterium]